MNGLLFPHTYLSEETARFLAVCFDRIQLVQPVLSDPPEHIRRLVDSGFLGLHAPVTGGELEIENACRDYEAWAAANPGVQKNAAAFLSGAQPFQEDLSHRGIRSEIRKVASTTSTDEPKGLFKYRLFLHLAHLHDMRQDSISLEMSGFASKYQRFLADLKGDGGDMTYAFPSVVNDARRAGDYMIAERLAAWAALLAEKPLETALFVTHSRGVLDDVRERFSDGKRLFSCQIGSSTQARKDQLASWRSNFIKRLETIGEMEIPEQANPLPLPPERSTSESEPNLFLEIVLLPHMNPRQFIAGLLPTKTRAKGSSHDGARFEHTLVGLLEGA